MNTFIEILGVCMDFIYNIAANISKTFTGADSAAALVMIIFYLVVLIAILLLLKLLVNVVKRFFAKKPRVAPVVQVEPEGKEPVRDETIVRLENFNGQELLDQLSTEYNKINESTAVSNEHVQLEEELPAPLPVPSTTGTEALTPEQLAVLATTLDGKGLDALQQLLSQTKKRETQLSFELSKVATQLDECRQSRVSLAEEEKAVYSKYNSGVVEQNALRDKYNSAKELLSVDYVKVFNLVSAFNAQRATLLEGLKQSEDAVVSLPVRVGEFVHSCQTNLQDITFDLQKKDETLTALKGSYQSIHDSRVKTDEKVISLQEQQIALHKEKTPCIALVALIEEKVKEAEKAENERRAAEYAERKAQEEQQEREREEMLRRAKEEAMRAAQEEEATRAAREGQRPSAVEAKPETAADGGSDLVALKEQLQSQGFYAINFEDLSPDQLEQIAAIMNKNKSLRKEEAGSDVKPDVDPASEQKPAEAVDHFAELQKQWAAEREHKEAWAAERAKKDAETEDRRRALSSNQGQSSGFDANP